MAKSSSNPEKVKALARSVGVLRPRDLAAKGIPRAVLKRLCQRGELIRTGRGLYVAAVDEMTENHSFAEVARQVPGGVICLLSALRFHGLTTQIPPDVWVIGREFEFDGSGLGAAVAATFKRRRTPLPDRTPFALTEQFSSDSAKQEQWQAFAKRGRLKLVEANLAVVVEAVRNFLMPVVIATAAGGKFNGHWPKGGPWHPDE